VVLVARPQKVGTTQSRGARGGEGDPVRLVSQGSLEVIVPNVASKPSRIALKARRGR
jgi:hypothetical protein